MIIDTDVTNFIDEVIDKKKNLEISKIFRIL